MTVRSVIDLQRRLHETGRIRHGERDAGGRPVKRETFRFTTQSRRAAETISQLLGGEVEEWKDAPAGEQWQVNTQVDEIDVVVIVGDMAFSQSYELWSAAGCKRRCNGERDEISGGACLCDPEKGRECKLTTRLSVMLAKVPGIGLWRIESHGWNSGAELAGSIEMAHLLAEVVGRSVLPAKLRLEKKAVKRPKKGKPDEVVTQRFVVVVLDFDVDMASLAVGASPIAAPPSLAVGGVGPAALPAASSVTPVPPAAVSSIAEQIEAAGTPTERKRRSNSPPALPSTGRRRGRAQPPPRVEVTDELVAARTPVLELFKSLPESLRPGYVETLQEEHGDQSTWTVEKWNEVGAWLKAEIASSEEGSGSEHDSVAGQPPPPAGSSPEPSSEDVPSFCAGLHARREALGIEEDVFRRIVSEVSGGRTTSTRDLNNGEAVKVMARLNEMGAVE